MLSFDFVVEVSSTSFCSNPDALGFDESEKGIFDSLKNIARLHLDSPKEGDRLADSAAGSAWDLVLREAGEETSAAGTGEWFDAVDWFFRQALLMSLYFQTSRPGIDRRVLCLQQMLIRFRWSRRSWRRRSWSRDRLL